MSGEYNIRKAYQAILQHDFEQAIDYFEQAIRQEPDNAAYHYRLSITCARSGKLAKALTYADQACRLDGDHPAYQYHLQNLRSKQNVQRAELFIDTLSGGAAQALPLLLEAIELDPLSIEAHLLLSIVYMELQDHHKAVEAAREALKLEPQHEGACHMLKQAKEQLTDSIRNTERDR